MSSAWSHGTSSSTRVTVPVHRGIEHHVESADLVNQAEEILQIHVLQIHGNRLAAVALRVHGGCRPNHGRLRWIGNGGRRRLARSAAVQRRARSQPIVLRLCGKGLARAALAAQRSPAGRNSARSRLSAAGLAASAELVLSAQRLSTGLATAADSAATALAAIAEGHRQRLVLSGPRRTPRAVQIDHHPHLIRPRLAQAHAANGLIVAGNRIARQRQGARPSKSTTTRGGSLSRVRGSSTAPLALARAQSSAGRRGPLPPARPTVAEAGCCRRGLDRLRAGRRAARAPQLARINPPEPQDRPVGLHCCSPGVG